MSLQSFGYAKVPGRCVADGTDDAGWGWLHPADQDPADPICDRTGRTEWDLAGRGVFSTDSFSYRHIGWNDEVALTKRPYTMSDLINVFSAARLWIEAAVEPQLSGDARRQYPHKQAWMNKYLGILMFKLRPLLNRDLNAGTGVSLSPPQRSDRRAPPDRLDWADFPVPSFPALPCTYGEPPAYEWGSLSAQL